VILWKIKNARGRSGNILRYSTIAGSGVLRGRVWLSNQSNGRCRFDFQENCIFYLSLPNIQLQQKNYTSLFLPWMS
jgi:hypothetical protein